MSLSHALSLADTKTCFLAVYSCNLQCSTAHVLKASIASNRLHKQLHAEDEFLLNGGTSY